MLCREGLWSTLVDGGGILWGRVNLGSKQYIGRRANAPPPPPQRVVLSIVQRQFTVSTSIRLCISGEGAVLRQSSVRVGVGGFRAAPYPIWRPPPVAGPAGSGMGHTLPQVGRGGGGWEG